MSTPIRKISIGTDKNTATNLSVGSPHPIWKKGAEQSVKMVINNIEETEKHYVIYVKDGDEVFKWQKVPKNDQTREEYYIY